MTKEAGLAVGLLVVGLALMAVGARDQHRITKSRALACRSTCAPADDWYRGGQGCWCERPDGTWGLKRTEADK